jgi:ankyrin repeat protein
MALRSSYGTKRSSFGINSAYGTSSLPKATTEGGLLHQAGQGDLDRVKAILEENPGLVDTRDSDGCTPLYLAAQKSQIEVADYLLAHGADPNAQTNLGSTPLHEAAAKNNKGMAALLLSRNANVNAKAKNGLTPLYIAAQTGKLEAAEVLLAHHAEVGAGDANGLTPLHVAARNGLKDMVELLLANQAQVDAQSVSAFTPLHQAAFTGRKNVVEVLLAHHAQINAQTKDGSTPLYGAAAGGYKDVVDLLLANHADDSPAALKGAQSSTALLQDHAAKLRAEAAKRAADEKEAQRAVRAAANEKALANIGIGALMFIVGMVVTIGTYSAASSGSGGGTYFLWWGPIIFGAWRILKGLGQLIAGD